MAKALTMALVMAKFDNRLTWPASGNAQIFKFLKMFQKLKVSTY